MYNNCYDTVYLHVENVPLLVLGPVIVIIQPTHLHSAIIKEASL